MRVFNATRQRTLADRAGEARTLASRLRGLLGRKGLEPGEGLYLRPCSSIHSCFMSFRFDAAFLDGQGIVLHLIHSMKPWRLSRIVPAAAGVLELPAGVLAHTGTRVGDRLEFLGPG